MKVLFVRFSSIGDVLLTTGVIAKFKEQNPDAEISFLTYESNKCLIENEPYISTIYTVPRNIAFLNYLSQAKELVKDKDLIIDLHQSIRSKILRLFKPFSVLNYKKHSLSRRLYVKFGFKSESLSTHVTERYAFALKKLNFKFETLEDLRPLLEDRKKPKEEEKIIIHPFASKKTKEWPYFKELIQKLLLQNFKVTVVGRGNWEHIEGTNNLVNKTSIKEMIKEISTAETVISNDSGPMHIGVALNCKVIGLFGPTVKEFGFFPQFKNCTIIENNDISCRPCGVHGLNKCPEKHFNCMKSLNVEKVVSCLN